MLNQKIDRIINKISKKIVNTKFENKTYLVGGYVRDLLLEHTSKDLDFVVNIPNGGSELAKFLWKSKICSRPIIYKSYGTAMVEIDHFKIEFVMTRKESYRDKDRNPEVSYGSILEDAFRRDFTINSLYLNISNNEISDFTTLGKKDIDSKIIRATSDPNIIFKEDPLRILRGIRLAGRLNFDFESKTLQGIVDWKDYLQYIHVERIKDEFLRIILDDGTYKTLFLCKEYNILKYMFPEINNTNNNFAFEKIELLPKEMIIRLAYLFSEIEDLESVQKALYRLRIKKNKVKKIIQLIKIVKVISNEIEDINYFVYSNLKVIESAILICQTVGLNICNLNEITKSIDILSKYRFPVNGKMIMNHFNISEGGEIGAYSKKALKIWIDDPTLKVNEIFIKMKRG